MIVLFSVRFLNTVSDTLSRRRRENVEDSAQFSLTSRAVFSTQTAVRGNAVDTHITEPNLAEGYFFSHDHLTQLLTQPRKTEIKPNEKVEYCGARGGYTFPESEQRYVYPLLLPNEITFITYLTRPVTCIIMLDERSDNECGTRRSELARNNCVNFFANGSSLVDYVAHNLESFVVPLMPIRQLTKQKRQRK